MELEKMTLEELELLSYTDMTYMLLKSNKHSMTTPSIFKKICELLEYSEDDFVSKIGDYYTSLTIDKRFTLLSNNEWDLTENHPVAIILDEDDEADEEVEEPTFDEEEKEIDIEEAIDDEELEDDIEDELEDLAIVDEDSIKED